MQEIMLSVAVITYNQEKYIAQTLELETGWPIPYMLLRNMEHIHSKKQAFRPSYYYGSFHELWYSPSSGDIWRLMYEGSRKRTY